MAGAAGIARLHDYLRAFPDDVAVLLSVELCSLTLQQQDLSIANLIASGLFGDGAAAVVAVGERRAARLAEAGAPLRGPQVVASRSRLYPGSERVMGWDIASGGFRIVQGLGGHLVQRRREAPPDQLLCTRDHELARVLPDRGRLDGRRQVRPQPQAQLHQGSACHAPSEPAGHIHEEPVHRPPPSRSPAALRKHDSHGRRSAQTGGGRGREAGHTILVSLIPSVGTALVWVPVAAGLALTGRLVAAAVLAAVGLLIVSTVDNLLRPVLARYGHLHLPTYVVFLAIFGGLALFGAAGLVLGPLLVRLGAEAAAIAREEGLTATPPLAKEGQGLISSCPAARADTSSQVDS